MHRHPPVQRAPDLSGAGGRGRLARHPAPRHRMLLVLLLLLLRQVLQEQLPLLCYRSVNCRLDQTPIKAQQKKNSSRQFSYKLPLAVTEGLAIVSYLQLIGL